MAKLAYLHIVVPQGEAANPKKENLFQQVLVNLHNTVKGKLFSLEMLGVNQYTYFYIVVEDDMVETIQGLIYSTFPDAEIYPTQDYTTLFNDKKHALAGVTLKLRYNDVYPFKDYDNFTEDSLSNLFSVVSKIQNDEQVWVQIVSSPLDETGGYHFTRNMKSKYAKIRQVFNYRDIMRMKNKKVIRDKRDELAKEKIGFEPYKVVIRCGYVANTTDDAKRKLVAVVNSFYQFGLTDIQEFTIAGKGSGQSFKELYARRSLNGHQLMGIKELSTLYHYPNADHTPHVVHVMAKKAEPPKDLPKRGTRNTSFFGTTNYHNNYVDFGIRREDRRRHLYAVGKSGSGKSKMLELLIKEDIDAGHGVGVLDPHGDLVDAVMRFIPKHRIDDVILFDPSDTEFPIAFNPLETVDDAYKMQLTIGFIQIFKKLFGSNWSDRLEHVLRYTTLALLDSPNTSVLSILKMLTDKNYRQRIVARIQDSVVKNFWVSEFAAWSEKFDAEAITPLLNKVGQLVATNMVRNIIGQPVNKFDIGEVMNGQKILLMKVSKGLLGEENSGLLGAMIITKIYQSAMQRASMKEEDRKDFYFYVDEFQNFATETFGEILSEARKYALDLTIAHQFMGQLTGGIRQTVFGNVGSMVSFRVGAEDARVLAEEYNPIFTERDIINLGVREFYVKMSVNGEIREAFSGRTLDVPKLKTDYTNEIIAASRAKYCAPRAEVEKMLDKWDEGGEDALDISPADLGEPVFEEPLI